MVVGREASRGCVCVDGILVPASAAASPFALAPIVLVGVASRVWGGFVLREVVVDRVYTSWLAKELRLPGGL